MAAYTYRNEPMVYSVGRSGKRAMPKAMPPRPMPKGRPGRGDMLGAPMLGGGLRQQGDRPGGRYDPTTRGRVGPEPLPGPRGMPLHDSYTDPRKKPMPTRAPKRGGPIRY